jgi:hypothetical protein
VKRRTPGEEEQGHGLGSDLTDDETPLGDTPEVHDEIAPQDLPRGHPSRGETARRTGRNRDRE